MIASYVAGFTLLGLAIGALFVTELRKELIWIAIAASCFALGYGSGKHDASKSDAAQQTSISTDVDKAVQSTDTPAAHTSPDRYDNPKN